MNSVNNEAASDSNKKTEESLDQETMEAADGAVKLQDTGRKPHGFSKFIKSTAVQRFMKKCEEIAHAAALLTIVLGHLSPEHHRGAWVAWVSFLLIVASIIWD